MGSDAVVFLDKASIQSADDLPIEVVEVPEWNGKIRVRTLTGRERDRLEADLLNSKKNGAGINLDNVRAKLVVATAIDEAGKPLFARGDEEWLGGKSGAALSRVAAVALRLGGLSTADVEDLAKNS